MIVRTVLAVRSSILAACLCVSALHAQEPSSGGAASRSAESRAESRATDPRTAEADAVCRALDARLYYPVREGLRRLRFSYAAAADGALQSEFRVQVTWALGTEPVVEFLDAKKAPLDRSAPHPILDADDPDRPGRKLADRYVDSAKALLQLFLRRPFEEQFAAWRRRIERRTVNGRDEVALVCEPDGAARVRRVELRFGADGLPARIAQSLSRAERGHDQVVMYPVFSTVADRLVLTSFKEDVAGRTDQVVFEYQKVGGFVLPASYERIVKDSKLGSSKTVFDDVDASK